MKKLFPKFSNRHQYDTKKIYSAYGLEASDYFWKLPDKEIKKINNGIGAAGKWYNFIIPKTCGFLNVEICSADHDIGYDFGKTLQEKNATDMRFKHNLYQWIYLHTDCDHRWLIAWRLHRARQMYWFVQKFGHKAFFKNKSSIKISVLRK